ncbi:MAG TPA: flagellar basal-body MS-ring/collar protein FliF [Myxococcales bacterium]|nr:flagellar basal-body MS-ring/collar protein FliF [Myxococcales bacterium]
MEPLARQLKALPARWNQLSRGARWALVAAAAGLAAVAVVASALASRSDSYQYAFTHLTPEDGSQAAATLKAAGIPFRLEAGGEALAVPSDRVYDARLLLASAGLPRGGGVGFELFDKGDLGVSELTQKVNLRRAVEGELARTLGRLGAVRSARVHVSFAEKGVFRGEDRPAAAAVALSLQPGRTVGERELAGIRHLVASAVTGLSPDAVTVVDGDGKVLTEVEGSADSAASFQKKVERDLEERIVSLLEPVVGRGAAMVRVAATVDASEVQRSAETFDPDQTALRSERKVSTSQSQERSRNTGGVAGAAANDPLKPLAAVAGETANKNATAGEEELKTYEVSHVTTTTTQRAPRIARLSVAVLLDGAGGQPRPDAEVARLAELVKHAAGLDEERGDQLDVSSVAFTHPADAAQAAAAAQAAQAVARWVPIAAGAGLAAAALALAAVAIRRRRNAARAEAAKLVPGATVRELAAGLIGAGAELAVDAAPAPAPVLPPALPDAATVARSRARELTQADPARAAKLLRAWISADAELLHQGARNG